MKEFLRRIVTHGYLCEHTIEDPRIVSLIKIAEETKRGSLRGSDEYPKALRLEFQKALLYIETFLGQKRSDVITTPEPYLKLPKYLELANQLYAIEQLGRSANKQALDYLRYLSTEVVRAVPKVGRGYMFGSDVYYDNWTVQEHSYPNARGALGNYLYFSVSISIPQEWEEQRFLSSEEIQHRLEILRQSPPHQILNKAIATLEHDLAYP